MNEMIYLYDGSFEGLLCCIFDSYANKEILTAIFSDEDFAPTLFPTRTVSTDAGHASRVLRKIHKLSPYAEELLRRGLQLGDNGIEVREYIYDMPLVMAASDLVLCRAGASTISELTAIAKPAVLVPSPNVTANHQEKNARVLADQGAAVLLREQDCAQDTLYETASLLLREKGRRENMEKALRSMAVPDAGEKIYETLREIMK